MSVLNRIRRALLEWTEALAAGCATRVRKFWHVSCDACTRSRASVTARAAPIGSASGHSAARGRAALPSQACQ